MWDHKQHVNGSVPRDLNAQATKWVITSKRLIHAPVIAFLFIYLFYQYFIAALNSEEFLSEFGGAQSAAAI